MYASKFSEVRRANMYSVNGKWNLIVACLLSALVSLGLVSCSESAHSETETYTIYKKGILIQETIDVIHVYGFADNREVAREMTDFLNNSEPNAYYFEESQHNSD